MDTPSLGVKQQKGMLEITDLFDELMVHVLSFLSVEDRKRARLVCKHWHELSQTPRLLREQLTVVWNIDILDVTKKYYNLSVMGLPSETNKFWKKCGQDLEHITLLPGVALGYLHGIVQHTPNLKSLSVATYLNEDFVLSNQFFFNNLVTLNVMNEGDCLKLLLANAPRLVHLSVGMFSDICSGPVTDFIKKQGRNMKSIGFPCCSSLSTHFLSNLCSSLGPHVSSLDVSGSRCGKEHFDVIGNHLPNLTEIKLSGTGADDAAYSHIIGRLKSLTRIHLARTVTSVKTLSMLASLTQLQYLDLENCHFMPIECLHYALGANHHPKLVYLNLSNLQVTDAVLKDILEHSPNLQVLILKNCRDLTNGSLQVISKVCKKIRHLNIDGVGNISEISLLNGLNMLTVLKVNNCGIRSSSFAKLLLPSLHTLNVGNSAIKKMILFSNCPCLSRII